MTILSVLLGWAAPNLVRLVLHLMTRAPIFDGSILTLVLEEAGNSTEIPVYNLNPSFIMLRP